MSYTLCIGEALIDFVSQAHVADVGASEWFRRAAGGAVANVAVGIARLGGHAHFAGTISNDAFGHFLVRTLAHENVNVDGVRSVDAHTTLAFVARGEDGERDFFFMREPGADSQLTPSDLQPDHVKHAQIVHFGGVLLSSEPARSSCLGAAQAARQAGVLVTFDPNARPTLFSSHDEMQRWLLAGCAAADVVKLSDDDLSQLGLKLDEAHTLLGALTRAVIVSRGPHGCRWMTADASGDVAAPHVQAVDTTGAGDAMMAAILERLTHAGKPAITADVIRDAARRGCVAGALACLREGAIPSLPTMRELEAMLSRVVHAT